MLSPRIIPCLLISENGLVKTVKFDKPTYVGDPINAVKIFNEKEVDELIILDIDATINNTEPNYDLINNIASECRMPLCYGGGVKSIEEIQKIISLGVEKVSICSSAFLNKNILNEGAEIVGSQSIVGCIDINIVGSKYFSFIKSGSLNINIDPKKLINLYVDKNVGEILINFINRDGTMIGFDINYINYLLKDLSVPVTIIGGAGSNDDFKKMVNEFGNIGVSAGSYFVFKGKYKAVLINYLDKDFKKSLIKNYV